MSDGGTEGRQRDAPGASFDAPVSRATVLAGARWRGLFQVSQQVLSVAATVVLARLLTPGDFGVVAAAMSVLMFLSLGSAWGFGAAVIRRTTLDQRFLGSVLATNLLLAAVLVTLGLLLSPVIANAIGVPEASLAIAAVMPTLLLTALQSVSASLMERRLQFGRMTAVGVGSTVLYVLVELVLAWLGYGYWAVIVGFLAMQVVQCVGIVLAAGWSLRLHRPAYAVRSEWRFSAGYFANEATQYVNRNADYWFVGALLGAAALGQYYIAFVLPTIVRMRLTMVVQQLVLPVFARLRSDPARARSVFRSATGLQAAVGLPAMVGLAVVAAPLVEVFFGGQWTEAVAPMRWIALAAVADLLGAAMGHVGVAFGQMSRVLTATAVRAVVFVVCLSVAGIAGLSLVSVAVAVLVTSVVSLLFTQLYLGARLGLHLLLVWRQLLGAAAASLVMAFAAWSAMSIARSLDLPAWGVLTAAVVTGALAYVGASRLIAPQDFRRYVADIRGILGSERSRVARRGGLA